MFNVVYLCIINLLFLDWSFDVYIKLQCFLYASVFMLLFLNVYLILDKLINPVGFIFNVCDRDLVLELF